MHLSPAHRTSVKDYSRIIFVLGLNARSQQFIHAISVSQFIFSCQATHFFPSLQSNNVSRRKRKENDITFRVLFERKHDYIDIFWGVHFKVSVTVKEKQSTGWSLVKDSSIFDRGGI